MQRFVRYNMISVESFWFIITVIKKKNNFEMTPKLEGNISC